MAEPGATGGERGRVVVTAGGDGQEAGGGQIGEVAFDVVAAGVPVNEWTALNLPTIGSTSCTDLTCEET